MSGSEKRQRTKGYFVRLSDDEAALIISRADSAALHPAAFLRNAGLDAQAPRAKRRPHPDTVLLKQILGQCGKIGSNLNQIAYQLNKRGEPEIPDLTAALPIYSEIRNAIYTALNMKPSDVP